ncbi:restriction endonuclease subunit S [Streptomyces sp. NPDC001651]|uniref:restriction endonuclease subunit S n=1 Tax=Streptomyces sp. NPDC001651 TaxID=3364596 RepID=UPI00369B60C7
MKPTNWRTVPLWSVATETRAAVDPSNLGDQVVHYSIPAVDATGTGQIEATDSIKSAKLLLRGGEVLVSKLNPRKSRVLIVTYSPLPIVSSTEFVGLVPGAKIEPRFLAYFLQSETTRQALDSRVQSVTRSHQRAAPEDVTHLPMCLPSLDEQRRIADFLDTETARLDRLVALRHNLIRLSHERDSALRDGLVNDLFASEGEVPLRRLTQGIEQGDSPQCDAIPREAEEWGVLKLSAVKHGVFHPAENKRLPDHITPNSAFEVRPGDLLITRANTPSLVGDAAIVDSSSPRLLLPDLIYRVRLVESMSADFLMHVALSGRTRSLIEAVARGSSQSMVKLRSEDIKSWPVPRANSTQQAELVREIRHSSTQTQNLRQVVERQITLLNERRQALITAAVTGQFDVSTASGRNVTEGVTA